MVAAGGDEGTAPGRGRKAGRGESAAIGAGKCTSSAHHYLIFRGASDKLLVFQVGGTAAAIGATLGTLVGGPLGTVVGGVLGGAMGGAYIRQP